ncbi:hypothetical protein DAEQUDRAFT_730429 [Daedalea quercina L-15889]|uniref:F-box domain-containing protein n=1 Tax=Daedalea quercina L-15889 TaxID=1314783 RepID=A0A165MZC4_9APHY|nr:hypothetical protein DAEQUDRAFT_730429 [Daedalea quercina L-15889]
MKPSLSSLPTEVVEIIVVHAAAGGFPAAIGALSQTCRTFHSLIYEAADHHLWRAIFLSTFDDPRQLRFYNSDDFDWGREFRERICAASFLKRHARPLRVQKVYMLRSRTAPTSLVDLVPTYDTIASVRMLNSLLSVIKTTAPDEHVRQAGYRNTGEWEAMMSRRSLSYTHHVTPQLPPSRAHSECLNVPWLQSVLKDGLPAPLITKISGDNRDLRWDKSPEALALGELIACTGFLPIHNLIEEQIGRLSSSSEGNARVYSHVPVVSDMDMAANSQKLRAHHCARALVYRMAYLSRRRHWGPYLPVAPSAEDEPNARRSPSSENNARRALRRMFAMGSDVSGSESDPDYFPDVETSTPSSYESDDASEEEPPLVDLVQSRKRKRVLPSPEQLRPDWVWLGAARILIQANLSDMEALNLSEFTDWNFWREAWVNRADDEPFSFLPEGERRSVARGGATTKKHDDTQQCRDWAAVQGVWRRAVTWLDYADLTHHNHFGGFDDPGLFECKIIVPLRLRVVGYDAPAVAAYPDRPTIKVEGEMGGQEFEGYEEGVKDDLRRIHGTVSMLATGHVRWCLTSSEEDDPNTDLWASEGVQIGAVGSDAGVLGMWTGARHEMTDPLGAFWQWRVA